MSGPAGETKHQRAARLEAERAGRATAEADAGPLVQNRGGKWVPDVPLPLFGLRKACSCGAKFWTLGGYRGHYALAHVLDLD